MPFDRITDEDLKAAWELVARLPHTYQAKTSRKSPQEAADEADATEAHNAEITRARLKADGASPGRIESEILQGRIKRLRTATIYRHMQDFQRICVFLVRKGHLAANIMADHIWETAEYERREILEEDNERLTWCGRLNGLFRSPTFQDDLEDVGDPMFWAPLIAVHMGLRSEEILQLYVADVQIIDDVPCIVLAQGPGQSLKSRASRRTVPIHDNLLKLGFMRLVAMLERAGELRLFPWLERSESKKTYTETFSKRFTRYRKDHRIYDAQRDFHALRTTFNHLLIQAECPDTQRRTLMGTCGARRRHHELQPGRLPADATPQTRRFRRGRRLDDPRPVRRCRIGTCHRALGASDPVPGIGASGPPRSIRRLPAPRCGGAGTASDRPEDAKKIGDPRAGPPDRRVGVPRSETREHHLLDDGRRDAVQPAQDLTQFVLEPFEVWHLRGRESRGVAHGAGCFELAQRFQKLREGGLLSLEKAGDLGDPRVARLRLDGGFQGGREHDALPC